MLANTNLKKSVLIIFFILINTHISTSADTTYVKDEVIVTASRVPQVYKNVARVISVISHDEIMAMPAASIDDILEYASNVDIRRRGPLGVQSDISIRGGTFEQVLVLLNGVPINDPQSGHHNLNIPVEPENIARIEVLSGPGSRVLGPNAFSGAVNIITAPAKNNGMNLNISGGEFGLYKISASPSFSTGALANNLSASRSKSDGYIDNTDFDQYNLFYQGKYSFDKSTLNLQAGYEDKQFGANSFYTPKYPDQFEQTKTTFANLSYSTGDVFKFSPNIYYRRNQDRFELFRSDPAAWYKGHNYHLTDVYGAQVHSSYAFGRQSISAGLEFRSENIKSNLLGNPTGDTLPVPGEPDGSFTRQDSREIYSIYAEYLYNGHFFNVSAGALINWNSKFGTDVYPGVDLSIPITDKLKAFGSVNRSLRTPTFTDLYYNGPTNEGNPNLVPEEALTFETGVKYDAELISGSVSLFNRQGKNIIDWVKRADTLKWQAENLTDVNSTGIDLSATVNLARLKGIWNIFKQLRLSYSFMQLDKSSGEYISKYVLDNLRHNLVIGLTHELIYGMIISWKLMYKYRDGTFLRYPDSRRVNYKPYWLMDFKLARRFNKYDIYLNVTNLFNTPYYDLANVILPGRWVTAGISYGLNFN